MTIQQTSNKITRRLREQERKLKQQLVAFYTKHIKGSNAPIQTIRQKYNNEIEQLIRNNVQISWLFANDIMAERTGTQINISVKDVQGIDQVTAEMTNQFWTTAQKNLQREYEYKLSPTTDTFELKPEYALPPAMLAVGSFMIYLAFNMSMESKATELNQEIRLRFTTRKDERVDPSLCKPLEGKIFNLGIGFIPTPPLHRHCRCHLIPILV